MIDTLFKYTPGPLKPRLVQGWELSRAALYVMESLPLMIINRGMLKEGFQAAPPATQKLILTKLWKFMQEDAEYFSDGTFPAQLLKREFSPSKHAFNYLELLIDSLGVVKRKEHQETKFFNDISAEDLAELPEYYRRNFHHQTDGYLSQKSARLYGHQVEILFRGTAAAMRRRFLVLMRKEISGKGRGCRFLDLACGAGDSTRVLQAAYPDARIEGLDLSEPYLLEAKNRFSDKAKVHFSQGMAEALPYRDELFDAITSVYLFHEIPREIREKTLKEVHRTLKPDGYFVFVDSIQLHDDPDLEWSLKQFPQDFHEPFYRHYVENPVEELAESLGFEVVDKEVGFFTKSLMLKKI